MTDLRIPLVLLLCLIPVTISQEGSCDDGVIESHGRAIVFLQQLRPVKVRTVRHLAVEVCPETAGNFYFQVWRNETTGYVPRFRLIWQYLVDREDPSQTLFAIPEQLHLDLTGLTPAHLERLYFGVTAPTTGNSTGKIPVRSYFSLDRQSLTSSDRDDEGVFRLGEIRQFIELYYPYYFVISLCEDGDINKCKLPDPPKKTEEQCGIPGRVISNVSDISFRGEVEAVMVDFCALNSSLEVVVMAPLPNISPTKYKAVWRQTVVQSGPLEKPTIVDLTDGPMIDGADYHLIVRSLDATPDGSGATYVPVRVVFDPVTLHTRTHTDSDVPATLRDALYYPYFLPVTLCDKPGCANPPEPWARQALGLTAAPPANTTTATGISGGDLPQITVIEWPPLPGPAGPEGPRGLPGEVGLKGDPGAIGPTGPAGPQGGVGPRGYAGYEGEVGFTGLTGIPSPVGEAGPPGPPGGTGETGDPGRPGQRGDSGRQGAANSPPAVGAASARGGSCACAGLVSSMLVLGLVIWAVLLTLLVLLLLVVATKKASAEHHRQGAQKLYR